MIKSTETITNASKAYRIIGGIVLLLIGILLGIIGVYFINLPIQGVSPMDTSVVEVNNQPDSYKSNVFEDKVPLSKDISPNTASDEQQGATGHEYTDETLISEENRDITCETTDSTSMTGQLMEAGSADNNEVDTSQEMITSKACNLRSGPGTSFDSIKVVVPQTKVDTIERIDKDNGTSWYEVSLEDGTTGYISEKCLKPPTSAVATVTKELRVSSCPSEEYLADLSVADCSQSPENQVKSSSEADSQPLVIEHPTEKYDYRPGDYHGELIQFMGRPISEVQAACPSFTNEWYGDHGDFYDNNWMTVNFCYKDVVNEIWLDAADPTYSLMGISIGMAPETARLILADHGYPFEYLPDNARYWMHSQDDHYEVEISTIDGKVSSMMYLDLTSVDPWWKSNGIIY